MKPPPHARRAQLAIMAEDGEIMMNPNFLAQAGCTIVRSRDAVRNISKIARKVFPPPPPARACRRPADPTPLPPLSYGGGCLRLYQLSGGTLPAPLYAPSHCGSVYVPLCLISSLCLCLLPAPDAPTSFVSRSSPPPPPGDPARGSRPSFPTPCRGSSSRATTAGTEHSSTSHLNLSNLCH